MSRSIRTGALIAAMLLQLVLYARPAAAADGDLVADVVVPDTWPTQVAPSVAFGGHYLYYVTYGSPVLHRIDVSPAGGTTYATGLVLMPVIGSSGIMTLGSHAS